MDTAGQVLGFLAVATATVNVIGGFLVTDRMLAMFRRPRDRQRDDT
jgi:NAD(P) transhydrogenase subunit alpha